MQNKMFYIRLFCIIIKDKTYITIHNYDVYMRSNDCANQMQYK